MAATLVGGAFLNSALNVLFDRLSSKEFINFFTGRKHDERLLKKLKLKLLGLNKVLNDAEDKQITDPAVKEWLDELKGAVYDAEDLVDEIATQALRCKVEAEYQSGSNQGSEDVAKHPAWQVLSGSSGRSSRQWKVRMLIRAMNGRNFYDPRERNTQVSGF